MPLGLFEREVLGLLAANRNPDSYVAGATILNLDPRAPRISRDVDLFHDTHESLVESFERDGAALRGAGYEITEIGQPQPSFRRVAVRRNNQQTKIEWAYDSAFRFFPVERDPDLGWRLNFWDAAVNKVLALAGRREIRDWIDVLHLHEHRLHLAALAWAGTGKDPGLSPEAIIQWATRQAVYRPEDLEDLSLAMPVTLSELKQRWLETSADALTWIARLPPAEVGCLYLNRAGDPVLCDPGSPDFPRLTRHFGSVKGAWPRVIDAGRSEITP